jgi:hypothetical protein
MQHLNGRIAEYSRKGDRPAAQDDHAALNARARGSQRKRGAQRAARLVRPAQSEYPHLQPGIGAIRVDGPDRREAQSSRVSPHRGTSGRSGSLRSARAPRPADTSRLTPALQTHGKARRIIERWLSNQTDFDRSPAESRLPGCAISSTSHPTCTRRYLKSIAVPRADRSGTS